MSLTSFTRSENIPVVKKETELCKFFIYSFFLKIRHKIEKTYFIVICRTIDLSNYAKQLFTFSEGTDNMLSLEFVLEINHFAFPGRV